MRTRLTRLFAVSLIAAAAAVPLIAAPLLTGPATAATLAPRLPSLAAARATEESGATRDSGATENSGAPEDSELDLAAAQATSTGQGVTVALLDSGVNPQLPEFAGHVTTGPAYVTPNADATVDQHGTQMASLILHAAPQANILSIRVIADGPYKSLTANPIASGINYAVAHGAKVISMSLSGIDYNPADAAAAQNAVTHGVVLLAAAGNNGAPAGAFLQEGTGSDGEDDVSYPGAYAPVIAVGAVDDSGQRASFSDVHAYVTVSAPGAPVPVLNPDGSTVLFYGTSEATALAAGVTALVVANRPGLAPYQVAQALESTARHPAGGWNAEVGYGAIDAAAALRAAAMRPAAQATAAVPYQGATYLGQAPAGTAQSSLPPVDWNNVYAAAAFFAVGAGLAALVVFRIRRARRPGRTPASMPTRPGFPSAAPPPPPPPPGFPLAPPAAQPGFPSAAPPSPWGTPPPSRGAQPPSRGTPPPSWGTPPPARERPATWPDRRGGSRAP